MTRPIYIDQLIEDRIVPKDVVEYIESLETHIDDLQEDLAWHIDNEMEGVLGEYSGLPVNYQSFQKGGLVNREPQTIDQLKKTSTCVRLSEGYTINDYLEDLNKRKD
jgi:hypothetical protein